MVGLIAIRLPYSPLGAAQKPPAVALWETLLLSLESPRRSPGLPQDAPFIP
jgi:hypothetical protein